MRIFCLLILLALTVPASADLKDPFDAFDQNQGFDPDPEAIKDQDKTAQELIVEAAGLLQDERPLDARTKLLRALQRDPKAFRAHIMLANYYISQVGHFRLALRYVKQAINLFTEQSGQPPYYSYLARTEHSYLLYLLSQAKLSLDDYQGALDVLDEYKGYGYEDDWYAGTRSWVLMKLGRIDEAIKIARDGLDNGSEIGRTLNMLGILLSMKGDREGSLQVFDEAARYEFSMGKAGSPATPLNNAGEVYKEIFMEPKAQGAWLKAISLPDGCEHVLPALNLALLLIDQVNFSGAKRAMDNFETCVAQFPLRNGEEHRALVDLIRGRVDYHSGLVSSAIKHFEDALEKRQWFGKIGTSENDLKVGLLISLARALDTQNYHREMELRDSWSATLRNLIDQITNSVRAWWLRRRAREILIEDLSSMEDLFIRNTDSMIEYPTFGDVLRLIPENILKDKIDREIAADPRTQARLYYTEYLAENQLAHGDVTSAMAGLNRVLAEARPEADALLRARALMVKLGQLDIKSKEYQELAEAGFKISPALLRNYGFPLPVNVLSKDESLRDLLEGTAFLPIIDRDLGYNLVYEQEANPPTLSFLSDFGPAHRSIKVSGHNLKEMINKLAEEVFTQKL